MKNGGDRAGESENTVIFQRQINKEAYQHCAMHYHKTQKMYFLAAQNVHFVCYAKDFTFKRRGE